MASKTIYTSAGYSGTLSVSGNSSNGLVTATINTGGTYWESMHYASIELIVDGASRGSTPCVTVSKNTDYSFSAYVGYGNHTITAKWNGSSAYNYMYPTDTIQDSFYYPEPGPTYYDHELVYNANGGTGAPPKQTKTDTSSVLTDTISNTRPTRSGYSFKGWALNSTDTTPLITLSMLGQSYSFNTKDVTLYAVWEENPAYLTVNTTGYGTVLINGEAPKTTYGKGEVLSVVVTPDQNRFYYLSSITKVVNGVSTTITNEHTVKQFQFDLTLTDDSTTLSIVFVERTSHSVYVNSIYPVSGLGEYLYLDTVVLVANFGGNLVLLDGWYDASGNKLSGSNPYVFKMPDDDITLTLRISSEIFTNSNIRQFALQNGKGEIYKLTSKLSNIFLNEPKNLGFKKQITPVRVGYSESVETETFDMPQPKAELVFYNETGNANIYTEYNNFIRFVSFEPLILWYKIPADIDETVYHIPVKILEINKEEIGEYGALKCSISFYGLNFWQVTNIKSPEPEGGQVEVYNSSDFNVGVKINVSLEHSTLFSNPIIKLIQNGEVYGAISILYDDLSKIEMDTRDKQQVLTLYDSDDEVITNSFAYINYAYADGVMDFPFPKLKQGYSTISFSYDDEDSTIEKIYLVEYDEEYISV